MKKLLLVSVIIPTRNSEEFLENCLESIKKQTYKNIEIIVVDNNSTDKTKEIATKYTKLVFNKGPERSAQRNFGASKSKGDYLLFIDSDMELSKKVVEECINRVQKSGGVIIPEKSMGEGFWAKCKALERSFYIGVDWIEAARFFPREVFNKFKGYDETQTGTEDSDFPQRIKEKFGENSILRINSFIYHHEGKLSLFDTLKKRLYYAKTANVYTTRKSNEEYFRKQSSILERYKLYFSDPKKLFKNPLFGLGVLFMKAAEFGVWGFGYWISKFLGR